MYTRETPDDSLLSWDALSLWRAMLCKFDRAGRIDTKRGVRGLAALVRMPLGTAETAIGELLGDGRVRQIESGYFAPNFVAAQTASKSDKQRQRESRERRTAEAGARPDIGNADHNHVTGGHAESQPVTFGHSLLSSALLCSADPLLCSAERESTRSASPPHTPQPDVAEGSTSERPATKRAIKLPDAWEPSRSKPNQAAEAEARARGVNLAQELEKMRDWSRSKGETRKDWDAQWRNWLRGARQTPGGNRPQQAVLSSLLAEIAEAERRGES